MPTYDYQCSECGHVFEETLKIADRNVPCETPCQQDIPQTKHMSIKCGGKINQVPGSTPTAFAYDNISSPGHTKKPPSWMTDKLKEIKKQQPKSTMSWHH